MKKKNFIIIGLLIIVCGAAYYFFFWNQSFHEVKKLVVINRGASPTGEYDFTIYPTDQLKEISDSADVALINGVSRIRGAYIAKSSIMAKIITTDNDTVNVIISFPGGLITDYSTERKFGFKDENRQRKLEKLFSF